MKIATKLLLLLMALVMCASCFVACGGDDVTTTTPSDISSDKVPGLNNQTYSGNTCNIWHKKTAQWGPGASMYTTDTGVSAVSRAATARLSTFQAATGVTLNFRESTTDGSSAAADSPDIAELRSLLGAASAGNVYDIVMPGGYTATVLATEGLFTNLGANTEINLNHPAWHENINNGLSICGGYFTVSGMFSVSNVSYTTCIFFDKTALKNLSAPELLEQTDAKDYVDADSLYQWAREGSWTYDKLLALSAAFTGENGQIADPSKESEGDRYGFEFQGTGSYVLFMSTGKKYIGPDEANQGVPTLKVGDADTVQVLNWIIDNITAKPYCHAAGGASGNTGIKYFGQNHQALFTTSTVGLMTDFAQLGAEDGSDAFEFGILPMPKMDYEDFELEAQENYYGAHIAWCSTLAAIPKMANDPIFSGFVLETFTEMGYTKWNDDPTLSTIWEAYVEDGLEGRYAPEPQDEEMLDLVLASATSDFGEFNVWKDSSIGNIGNKVRNDVLNGVKEWEVFSDNVKPRVDAEIIQMLVKMELIA